MKKTTGTTAKRLDVETKIAASLLYYDEEEFNKFFDSWSMFEDDPSIAPSGQMHNFIHYMSKIHKQNKNKENYTKEEYISKLKNYNSFEPDSSAVEQFDLFLEAVKENDHPYDFVLCEELINQYSWYHFKDKINKIDKTSISFKEKLLVRPVIANINDSTNNVFTRITDVNEDEYNKESYTTGIEDLDEFVKPQDSNFMVVAARPSVGKSVFLLQMALNNAKKGVPTLFISLENTNKQTLSRLLNWYKGRAVDMKKEYKSIKKEEKYLQLNENFFLITNKTNNGDRIIELINEAVEKFGVKNVYVDYLQLIRFPDGDEFKSLRKATFSLKQSALKNNILVVSCSQVSRSTTVYGLELSSMFGSASIEADADIVIGLEVPAGKEKIDNSPERQLNTLVLKNRDGAQRNMRTNVNYITMEFENY